MADKITKCNVIKEGSTIIQYDFDYDVEHGAKKNSYCVTVLASEMTTPSDTDEAKTLSKAKAKEIKNAWKALPDKTGEDVPSVVGDVDLS